MNGAQSLIRSLVNGGVTTCFANPGTSEMHFVHALDSVPEMRPVLCLFEGVVTGCADGYGRMVGRPACTLLHLGPGLANGLANLHNARRARVPIVNVVGEHATYHRQYDAPLTSDIEGFAKPVSGWVHVSPNAKAVGADGARAIVAAMQPPGQIATLILPANTAWEEAEGAAPAPNLPGLNTPDAAAIERTVKALKNGKRTVILLGTNGLLKNGLELSGRIAAATGARFLCDTFTSRLQRGAGIVRLDRLPYFGEQVVEVLAGVEQLVLAGTKPPVSFFAYPGKPSWLTPEDCEVIELNDPSQDTFAALEALADAVGANKLTPQREERIRRDIEGGSIKRSSIGAVVANHMPEDTIISDEGGTSVRSLTEWSYSMAPHDVLSLTGGSIGQGIPVATGAAVACPDRKVIALQGEGGGMYTIQALWTQARENLDVTNIVFNNRSYGILNVELGRVQTEGAPGPRALSMLDLTNPELNFVDMAKGMGVNGWRVTTAEEFEKCFSTAMRERGPHLIEVMLPPLRIDTLVKKN
jgi:acetolactate synthase-1/2/3 large subunit